MSVASDILGQELATLAFCWRLERRDGVAIGLTSHDRDLLVDGFPYRAAPGIVPSSVRTGSTLEVDSMDVRGGISAGAIDVGDLAAGRWDAAALWLHLTEWTAPGDMWVELARGTLGAVEREGNAFGAELRGPAAVLERSFAPETSPGCRAVLGDGQCRVDLGARRRLVVVSGVVDEVASVMGGGLVAGDYAFGSLRWMSGRNAGLSVPVVANDADGVTLADAPAFAVDAGTRAMLVEGCDKRLESCSGRFANGVNFRGEPWLPGNDLLTRYPGVG